MDRAKLEALEKLLAKATPGPWFAEVSDSDTCDWEVNAEEGKVAGEYGIESRDDAALMVAAVNALPALLRLARAVVDAHQGTVSQVEWEDSDRIIPHIDKDEGGVLMWQDIAQGQRVLLLRADAADTTAGEAEPEGRG